MKFDNYDKTMTIRQLQKFVGTDIWVYGWLTSWQQPHDYFINIVNLSVDEYDKGAIDGYFVEAFYMDLLLESNDALPGDCDIILDEVTHTSDNISHVSLDDLDFPVPVDVVTTEEILEGLRNMGYEV